jgi:hypothetical protein
LEATPPTSIIRTDLQQTNYTTTNHLNGSINVNVNIVIRSSVKASSSISTGNLTIGFYPLHFNTDAERMDPDTWNYADYNSPAQLSYSTTLSLITQNGVPYVAQQIKLSLNSVDFWSTKHPNLYALIVNLTGVGIADQFCTQIGFRNITTEGEQLLLNGAGLKLAGVSVHEQYPAPIGRSLNDSLHYQDLSLVNATGSNWWRCSYPFDPIAYIYSDRLGLACWEEAPVFWANEVNMIEGVARGTFTPLWIEMLYRDYNRPSILFWSGGDEPWAQQGWFDYLSATQTFLNQNDPNDRIFSFACVSSQSWNPAFRLESLRVITPNTYAGTFEGTVGDFYGGLKDELNQWTNANPGKPLVSLEWGFWRSGNDSEQQQCFEDGFRAFSENPTVQGFTWWLAFDYYGTNYYNSMGIYNIQRTWHSITFDSMVLDYTNYTRNNL